jgi:hypothetical protein
MHITKKFRTGADRLHAALVETNPSSSNPIPIARRAARQSASSRGLP